MVSGVDTVHNTGHSVNMTTSTHIDIALCDRCAKAIMSDDVMAGIDIDGQEPEPTGRNVRGYGECFHCGDAEIDPAIFELEVRS